MQTNITDTTKLEDCGIFCKTSFGNEEGSFSLKVLVFSFLKYHKIYDFIFMNTGGGSYTFLPPK